MAKMTLQPRPLRVQVVVASLDMVPPDCCATLFVTRAAARTLGLFSGESRSVRLSTVESSLVVETEKGQ